MENIKIKTESKKKIASIIVNSEIYDLDAIHDAALKFLETTYLFLDGDPQKEIVITLKGKDKLSEKELKELAGEFCNELIHSNIRSRISKKNKMIREYIVSTALIGASEDLQERIKKENTSDNGSEESDSGWDEDPLGIASSWEEQHEKEEKNDN